MRADLLASSAQQHFRVLDDYTTAEYLRRPDTSREDALRDLARSNPLLAFRLKNAVDPATVIQDERRRLDAQLESLEREKEGLSQDRVELKRLSDGVEDLEKWASGPMILEAANESSLHKLNDKNVLSRRVDKGETTWEIDEWIGKGCEVFLVQHDWASLLTKVPAENGQIRLPYERSCFEFQISGRRFLALFLCEDGEPACMVFFVRVHGGWLYGNEYLPCGDGWISKDGQDSGFLETAVKIIGSQVRAIAITLDAAVTVAEVVRAPYRLNVQKTKRGETPVFDHHLISLVTRGRTLCLPTIGKPLHHKRLHFRRGHWRHYENHKTWIKWMLVGDPALGFVSKDYAL